MQLHYTRTDIGRYRFRIEGSAFAEEGEFDRSKDRTGMVAALCEHIVRNKPKRVEVYIDGSNKSHCLNYRTVLDIIDGSRTAVDLTFGQSQFTPFYRMWAAISRWFVLRPMPGQEDTYECPACGRGAVLEATHLHCDKCEHSFVCSAQYAGVSADIMESLQTNKDLERYYIDRPWNEHPPWMSREELTEALGLLQEHRIDVRGGTDGKHH
jgi:ribosomal protein L37AE/L43A